MKRSDDSELGTLEIAKTLDLSTISNLVFLIRLLICDPNFSFGLLYNPKVCGATFVKKKGFFFIPIYYVILSHIHSEAFSSACGFFS